MQLFFYFALCLALLVGVSSLALYQNTKLSEIATDLGRRKLREARILGTMSHLLSEIRKDCADLAAAGNRSAVERAEASAAKHLAGLAREEAAYLALPARADEQPRPEGFKPALRLLLAEHGAWVAQPPDVRLAELPEFHRRAQGFLDRAERAITEHIAGTAAEADVRVSRARQLAQQSFDIFVATQIVVALLGLLVFIVIRDRISRPLTAITNALSALAAGNRSVVIPESNRHDEIGRMSKAFEVFRANAFALHAADVEAAAARLREQKLARHDLLTGLPNRRVLVEELEKALSRADRSVAALLIDLDRFKPVNAIHGRPAGDHVLSEVARRLKGVVRGSDTLARIGGDEFAIVAETARTNCPAEALMRLAQRVHAVVGEPIAVGDVEVEIGASIGIAVCPADGDDADVVLRAADIAMDRAKQAGRGTFRFYEHSMDMELRSRAALEADIRHAVEAGDITPCYQPLVDLRSGRHIGFEILARWTDPERGVVPPTTFIPIIEQLGLVSQFTCSLLRQACRDARLWPSDLALSLNISPIELTDPQFPTRLLSVLSDCGFPPQRLEIEITENALVTDLETAKSSLASLQEAGVRIALDDFGTGYSSLYHLRELHLDKIKIDRSFVHSINKDLESLKLVNAIVGLAKSLGLTTTAEGIECADILERMTEAGVDSGQGYYFSRALPAAEATAWMELEAPLEREVA